jgi:tetratricopeptide (TPR) repeat protein
MSETHTQQTTPTPPKAIFRGKLLRRRFSAAAGRDEFALSRNILRYIFYAGLTGVGLLLVYSLRSMPDWKFALSRVFGSLSLFAFAAVAAGSLVGFLFGIPRTLQSSTPAPTTSYQVNTNLEQISDWLTKIIVGLGLINLTRIPGKLMELNDYVAASLGVRPPGPALVGSAAVFFAAVGFLLGYLSTRLFISGAFRKADIDLLRTIGEAAEPFAKEGAQPDPDTDGKPVDERVTKLVEIAEKTDVAPSAVAPDVARQLGRAFAASSNFSRAVPFYERAGAQRGDDETLAVEYAYALGESGLREQAIAFLEDLFHRTGALKAARLLGYFFLWIPEHIDEAIGWTRLYLDSRPDDAGSVFNLACGYAQRYGRKGDPADLDKAVESLQRAIQADSRWRKRAQELRHEDFDSLSDPDFARATAPTT